MEDLVIQNGTIVTPCGVIIGNLWVRDGKITNIGTDSIVPPAKNMVDAAGNYVLPGIIDPHVHFSASTEEELVSAFQTESISGVIGGVTTMLSYVRYGNMMEHCIKLYRNFRRLAEKNFYNDFRFHAYLFSDEHLAEITAFMKEGITSGKLLLGYKGKGIQRIGMKAIDLGYAYQAMEIMSNIGPPALIMAHCEQPDIISTLTQRLRDRGENSLLAWAESRPSICETIHVMSVGLISLETKCPVYLVHLSAKDSIDAVKYLRQKGAKIYAETCPQYLTLNKNVEMGVLAQVAPPYREKEDINHLWLAAADGTIDTIGSDHCLRYSQIKEKAGIWDASPGMGGVGSMLPIMISEGVNKDRITIEKLIKLTSENAAKIWGIYPRKGALSPGSDADIAIVDPNLEWVLTSKNLRSASDYTVFEGMKIKGKVTKTFIRGELVAEDGELVKEYPTGKYVHYM